MNKTLYGLAGVLLLLLLSGSVYGQRAYMDSIDGKLFRHKKNRNVFWFTPSNADQINGIAFGMYTMPCKQKKQTINGLNIELPVMWVPRGIFIGIEPVFLPLHQYMKQYYRHDTTGNKDNDMVYRFFTENQGVNEQINGLDLSLGALGARRSKGLNVNVVTSMYKESDGVAISALANWVEYFHGVLIAPVGNVSRKGSGLQIGLFNSCLNCSGLQIGLINQNGKRIRPLINYRSKKRARKLSLQLMPQ